ncbi:hypothetical protein H0H87_008690, partial [Tephrocybe sp. NHM501043]
IEGYINNFEKGKIEKMVTSTSIAVAVTSAGLTKQSQMHQLHSYYKQLEESDKHCKSRLQAGSRTTEHSYSDTPADATSTNPD